MAQDPLTHDEVWDDSALIEAWDSAHDEYMKYHSVFAQGGSIEELEAQFPGKLEEELRRLEEANGLVKDNTTAGEAMDYEEGECDDDDYGREGLEGESFQGQNYEAEDYEANGFEADETLKDDQARAVANPGAKTQQTPQEAHPIIPPQAVLGTVQDENLKRMLMSWYYAGYYTGLYEGQHQAPKS